MLHYVHQLLSEQIVYSGFLQLFSENDSTGALRVNQNSKVVAGQINNELKLTIKLHIQLISKSCPTP